MSEKSADNSTIINEKTEKLKSPPVNEARQLEQKAALNKMRKIAGALLIFMAIVFVISFSLQEKYTWLVYVRAAAEGGMVGGLADWFAVTALFRYPMGLKIPHTAIIPNKKDDIGKNLTNFVEDNFLSEEVVLGYLKKFSISEKVGDYVANPENAEKLTDQIADGARGMMNVLKDDEVQDILADLLKRHVLNPDWGPYIGKLGTKIVADRHHDKLVDILFERAYDWALNNKSIIENVVEDRSPTWVPGFVDNIVGEKVHKELVAFIKAVRDDQFHDVRMAIDRYLIDLTQDLQYDPKTIEKVENLKKNIMNDDQLRNFAGGGWDTVKNALLAEFDDRKGLLRQKITKTILDLGHNLQTNAEWQGKIDNWVRYAAVNIIKNYRHDIAGVIETTVKDWDANDTSEKIEIAVGKDLQFIRINGTVVGSLAGLVITFIAYQIL
ncbi:MAG: DUF445 domain-containing protein [Micrococcaceae bacterium]